MRTNSEIFNALVNLNESEVKSLIKMKLKDGTKVEDIMNQLQDALIEIGTRFEREEYFVPDLIYSGAIMKEAEALLGLSTKDKIRPGKGKVIIGTVFGDIHDIGKDLVGMLLGNEGFEIIDLGASVEPKNFIKAVRESGAKLVGLSCLLTISFGAIAETVNEIKKAGLRDNVSIMVGGAPVTDLVAKKTGCDFYGKDAFSGIKFASEIYLK